MPLPAFLAGKSASVLFKKIGLPLLIAAAVIAILMLTYCEGKSSGTAKADLARERGNVETLEKKGRADEAAAGSRLSDGLRQQQEQTQLEKVTANETDPRERRRAFHRCLRLQQSARAAGDPAPVCE